MIAPRMVRTLAVVSALLLAVSPAASSEGSTEKSAQKAGSGRVAPSPVGDTFSAADLQFSHSSRQLRYGSPRQADLLPEYVDALSTDLRRFLEPSPEHPLYAGGVVLAARHGVIAKHDAAGKALRYTGINSPLPPAEQVPTRNNTIYDLASVTKMFTSIAVMQQVESGRVDLDQPVATYLPDFAQNGKADVTVRDLLTHTGGLPAWLPLYSSYDTVEERLAAVLAVTPASAPGEKYVYSDLGLITLGLVVEEVTGKSLDTVIADDITEPLGMDETMFNPPPSLRDRVAATEAQPWTKPARPMIRGEVHDENAWSLRGVAGHAGLFSTARDLAVLAQTLLNGGRYGHERILDADSVRDMITNENTEFPANSHGLGFELDQRLVHGRHVVTCDVRAHRLHGYVVRRGPDRRLLRHLAHQPGAPDARLGQQQPCAACGRAGPGPCRCRQTSARTRRMVLRSRGLTVGNADPPDLIHVGGRGDRGLQPLVRHRGVVRLRDVRDLDGWWADLDRGAVHPAARPPLDGHQRPSLRVQWSRLVPRHS